MYISLKKSEKAKQNSKYISVIEKAKTCDDSQNCNLGLKHRKYSNAEKEQAKISRRNPNRKRHG